MQVEEKAEITWLCWTYKSAFDSCQLSSRWDGAAEKTLSCVQTLTNPPAGADTHQLTGWSAPPRAFTTSCCQGCGAGVCLCVWNDQQLLSLSTCLQRCTLPYSRPCLPCCCLQFLQVKSRFFTFSLVKNCWNCWNLLECYSILRWRCKGMQMGTFSAMRASPAVSPQAVWYSWISREMCSFVSIWSQDYVKSHTT